MELSFLQKAILPKKLIDKLYYDQILEERIERLEKRIEELNEAIKNIYSELLTIVLQNKSRSIVNSNILEKFGHYMR